MDLQALEQKHKELGEEIERLKQTEGVWVPSLEDYYFYPSVIGESSAAKPRNCARHCHIHHHIAYQTHEQAVKAGILQRRANLIIQVCLNFDPDFEPDWSDDGQPKFGFYYGHYHCSWRYLVSNSGEGNAAYVSTPAIAKKVVAYLNSQEIK
jgi:hypothetical protein